MKIQYCSDLHLEFPRNKMFLEQHPIEPIGAVLILAGDILPFEHHKTQNTFIDCIAGNFEMVFVYRVVKSDIFGHNGKNGHKVL